MELIRGIHNIKPKHQGCVLTIGNFDGVHLGHLSVLAQVKQRSAELSLPSLVMTFDPQPVEVLLPHLAPARLIRWREKYQLLSAQAIDRLLCIRFNQKVSQLSATDFVSELLVKKLGVKHIVVGDDFRFGCKRSGDFALLQTLGKSFGFTVEDTQSCQIAGQRVSSTAIRQAIADNDFGLAQQLLGRPYSVWGTVIHGQKKGRTIGFPTANILLNRKVSPVQGVFVVTVKVDGRSYQAVANVGYRPTVSGKQNQLEVHLFDYQGDLYQKRIEVVFCKKLRDEKKFESFQALKHQIELDAQAAKQFFVV
ncbi:bifunctional riboflavin kinase/FAD synthetase [Catenovulum sp. 2E275]|uniref:bifunctional riboflavin kinase/FAD synthetase n=1 Tax=Catenovulum sp. 2E275 TaxID=2980497 RepID=UPI0021D2C53A|nr:bifunctional riboflavin kinase/FAD synthetase [Catenovulum sp. 2E275]MCU4676287.1 bifunctional riboflavin kinase/FAD synthetase [Catenovulum sp. 2E275]